jgi:hypothetical protein
MDDREGMSLALQQRAQVHRIRLWVPPSHDLEEGLLVEAMEMEIPILEYLYIGISEWVESRPDLVFHHTFQAPRLSHLALTCCPLLVASPSLTTSAGIVTLTLMFFPSHCRHHPFDLLRRLSLLSQLVMLRIGVADSSIHELEGHQLDISLITHFTLPNLRLFEFMGFRNYLEILIPWITTPLLEKLQIIFLPDLTIPHTTYTLSCLLEYMRKADVLGFDSVKFSFNESGATAWVYPRGRARVYVFYLRVFIRPLGLQVSEMAEIFEDLRPAFSAVADLTIDYKSHGSWSERASPRQWRDLLRTFNHVKTLRVHGLISENFPHSLLSDGEPLPEILPDLQVLECPVGCDASDAFATFVDVRRAAGYPIRLDLVDSPENSPANTGL